MILGGTLTRHELHELLAAARGRRHRAGARHRNARRDALLLELVALCGLRVREVLALQVRDLPPGESDSTLLVRFRSGVRFVPMPWRLARRLWHYVSLERLVLEERLFPITERVARAMFRTHADRAGLAAVLTLDSLRGYAAAREWEREPNLQHVARRLGNCSLKAAQRFVAALGAQSHAAAAA